MGFRNLARAQRGRVARKTRARERTGPCIVALGLVALSIHACGGDPTGLDLLLSFTVERFDATQGSIPSDAATGGVGTITISGGIQAPCLAQPTNFGAVAEREDRALALQIRLELEQSACTPGVDAFTYEAQLGNLESGTYQLTVSQLFLGQGGYVTLDTDVEVN